MSRHLRLPCVVFVIVLSAVTISASAAFATTQRQAAKMEMIAPKIAPTALLISPDDIRVLPYGDKAPELTGYVDRKVNNEGIETKDAGKRILIVENFTVQQPMSIAQAEQVQRDQTALQNGHACPAPASQAYNAPASPASRRACRSPWPEERS